MKLFCETSSGFELDNIKNAAILRDFHVWTWQRQKRSNSADLLNVWTWQRQKRSNSARLPQCLNLTTSKTKQFCETSSFFKVDNIKNEAILRDFLIFSKLKTSKTKQFCETSFKNGKLSAELTASYQCVLRFFQSTCLKYCSCHEKVIAGRTKCCTCHAKSSQQTWKSQAPKCNPSQEISARTS